MTFTIEDTKAPFDFFAKDGYYQVGSKIFSSKIRALQEASLTNQSVSWNFNNSIYKSQNWVTPIRVSLLELYKARAQQLREKYNYLVLMFSGGADSTTILDAFVKNNIKLDEIVVIWPLSNTRGKYAANKNPIASNILSEWDYAIEPKLNWLRTYYPEIKITVVDFLVNPDTLLFGEHTVNNSSHHNFGNVSRVIEIDRIVQAREEQYKNVGTILGIGRLECVVVNNEYLMTYFSDVECDGITKSNYTDTFARNIEFFFWTPDMPEIVVEQSQRMLDELKLNINNKKFLIQGEIAKDQSIKFVTMPDKEASRIFKKQVIYPEWDETIFQARKIEDTIGMSSWQSWFYSNPHSHKYVKQWAGTVKSEMNLIDAKYFTNYEFAVNKDDLLATALIHEPSNSKVIHYKPCISQFYLIGKISNP